MRQQRESNEQAGGRRGGTFHRGTQREETRGAAQKDGKQAHMWSSFAVPTSYVQLDQLVADSRRRQHPQIRKEQRNVLREGSGWEEGGGIAGSAAGWEDAQGQRYDSACNQGPPGARWRCARQWALCSGRHADAVP